MARRPSKHLRAARPLSAGHASSETKADGTWVVRSVPGARAEKEYRCPGCQQVVVPGTPHVVAWPDEGVGGVGDRRHWHTPCWSARERRHPPGAIR